MKKLAELLEDAAEFERWATDVLGAFGALNAILQSGMLDDLGEEPQSLESLAGKTGIPADKVARLVYFLAGHELVDLTSDGSVTANTSTARLKGVTSFMRVLDATSVVQSHLYPALQKGVTSWEQAYGMLFFEYLRDNPVLGAAFNDYMTMTTRRQETFIFEHHRFEPFAVAVDIGGSAGTLLLNLMKHYPGTRGILFDLPEVVAHTAPIVRAADHGERVELVCGSFFEQVPAADLYLLKQILHDWNDEECTAILKTVRKTINPGGRIAVIDQLLPETPVPSEALTMDYFMMVHLTGKERKRSDFAALFAASGFKLDRVSENSNGVSVIEAVPV